MRLPYLLGAAAAVVLASFATANAQEGRTQVGLLECHGGKNVGMVVASTTQFDCVFTSRNRRPEPYIATVTRFGLDIGVTERTDFAWAVNAPTRRIGRGDLSGNYGGVGGNASIGIGGGGNLLVGGSDNSIALQPLSVQGQTGLNASGGLVGLELRPGGIVHHGKTRHHRRHKKHHRHHR
jgi:hypothetical protein